MKGLIALTTLALCAAPAFSAEPLPIDGDLLSFKSTVTQYVESEAVVDSDGNVAQPAGVEAYETGQWFYRTPAGNCILVTTTLVRMEEKNGKVGPVLNHNVRDADCASDDPVS